MNDNIRAMARRFAGEGYAVLAVDLYEGKLATTSEAAMAAMQGAMERPARLMENLRQARGYLATQGGATKIGVVGWCFGGGWALETALGIPDGIDAAVMYYGRTQSDPKALAPLQAPLLGLFGGKDEGIPVDGVRQMEHELVKLGKNATIVIYPEADHAFANPTGNRYLAGPATDAWEKTMALPEYEKASAEYKKCEATATAADALHGVLQRVERRHDLHLLAGRGLGRVRRAGASAGAGSARTAPGGGQEGGGEQGGGCGTSDHGVTLRLNEKHCHFGGTVLWVGRGSLGA